MSNIAKAISISSGRNEETPEEKQTKSDLEKQNSKLEILKQQWRQHAETHNFIVALELEMKSCIEDAMQRAVTGGSSKAIRKQLIKAQTLKETINYARGIKPINDDAK